MITLILKFFNKKRIIGNFAKKKVFDLITSFQYS